LSLSIAVSAGAAQRSSDRRSVMDDVVNDVVESGVGNHGPADGHLPASKKNMKVISKLRLTDIPGGVSDVNYHKGHAYVGKYIPTCVGAGGTGAGVHVVDVRKPSQPREVAFIRAGEDAYISEGLHALSINTPFYKGPILLHSNESCGAGTAGGFSIYNVKNPAKPKLLVDQFGDTDANDPEDPTPLDFPNAVHSVMAWQDGNKAYAVAVDNFEFLDVDIFDISDPRNPVMIAETGLEEWDGISDQVAHGESIFHHDMWVKKIDGHWMLLVSYWDVGWVLLNVDNPANPVFVTDSDYTTPDPQMPQFQLPEGNAHQAAWTKNNKFIIGTDEDFAPYRSIFRIESGDNAGEYPGGEFGWTPQIASLYADSRINGPAVWGGTACPGEEVPDAADHEVAEGEEKILIVSRGVCFFSEKVESGELAGWDAVIVGNSHGGSGGGAAPDATLCGSQGHPYDPTIVGGCIGHRAMHLVFGDEPAYEGPDVADMPALGTVGEDVTVTSTFDGWGYIHLLDGKTLEPLDSYAVPEALDEQYADIFPLSVHEVKTDARRSKQLGYISWYKAGARVVKVVNKKLREVGHFIAPRGNDMWGVFPIKRGTKRPLLLYSDRDFGLYILKYTGPQ
jgi:hypothetical protein